MASTSPQAKTKIEKPSAFAIWINAYGPKKLAGVLGVNESTVRHWRSGRACPRTWQVVKIRQLSKGKITYDVIVAGLKNEK